MKILYQYDITGEISYAGLEEGVMDEVKLDAEDMDFVVSVADGFVDKREEIDGIISAHSHSWKIERIAKVDLAILRLALFEIKYLDTPSKVAVNEAVEIAKKYSDDKSYQFINGLLGGYLKSASQ